MLQQRTPARAAAALLALALAGIGCGQARAPSAAQVGDPCLRCHGGAGGVGFTAPSGATSPADPAVGAHASHVRDGDVHAAFGCPACHANPHAAVPGEVVVFGDLARTGGAQPRWDPAAATCSGVYCHGATLGAGGTATAPVWTLVDGSQGTCGSCHGAPPPGPRHPQGALAGKCHLCHRDTLRDDDTIDVAGGKHVDGALQAAGACNACHPDPGGAHRAHGALPGEVAAYGVASQLEDGSPQGGPGYAYGCGQCHPLDFARHLDGAVEVELAPATGLEGTLRGRNAAGAAYDPATGTCSGVYCHSSGQAAPAYAATPAWRSGAAPGCGGCHGNPPRYASGPAGGPAANSHLGLADDGYEFGHFAGLPGPTHTTRHGGNVAGYDAAPITCQTCHFDTVDPGAAGPSGFWWLDTTGDYRLPGGLLGFDCSRCHGAPGGPPAGQGRVRPLRHVNGRADVAFDPRTSLPASPGLPAAPNTPALPYWVTGANVGPLPPDARLDGTTLSLHLGAASYDPATRTCSGVGCHLGDAPVWGRPYRILGPPQDTSCCRCHAGVCR